MDVSSVNSDLIRGNVTTIILKALSQEDRYGYDILREIEVKSSGQYQLKQPTLYSCLKRLEKQGLISSYWGDQSDTEGGRRRYYSLTQAGKDYLDKMQSEYEYSRTILDNLLTDEKFDFDEKEAPFDINSLRPYTKRSSDDNQNDKTDRQIVNMKENEKKEFSYVAPSFFNKKEENDKDNLKVDNDIKMPQIFEPLNKGGNSYDEGFRHTTKSVNDILGQISNIIDNKDEKIDDKEVPLKDESAIDKVVKADNTEEKQLHTYEQTLIDDILGKKAGPEEELILSDEEIAEKRQNAKKTLGIGQYQESRIDLEKYDLTEKKIEKAEKPAEISEEDKKISQTANSIKEELSRNRLENENKNVISNEQKEIERKASRDLLFGNQKKENIDNSTNEIKGLDEPFSIFDKYSKKKEVVQEKESKKVELMPSPVAPASTFSFRQDKESVVNYRDAFSPLRQTENDNNENNDGKDDFIQKPASNIDLKTKLFSEGYKLRPYSRQNTEDYYSLNYIKKNKINRDCYFIVYALICLEVLIGYGIFKDRFSSIVYAAICIATLLVPAIPFVIWTINPDKRTRADFNFRTSILNRLMLYLNLLVVVFLVGFFGVGANINDGQSMIAPILVPAILLLNIPISSVIYLILYKTKKYHIS